MEPQTLEAISVLTQQTAGGALELAATLFGVRYLLLAIGKPHQTPPPGKSGDTTGSHLEKP